jgi:hypothetical protein
MNREIRPWNAQEGVIAEANVLGYAVSSWKSIRAAWPERKAMSAMAKYRQGPMQSELSRRHWVIASLPAALLLIAAWPSVPVYAQESRAPQAQSAAAASGTSDAPAESNETSENTPGPRGKRLFLTDGSFQIVREYQRQGERVRYYSAERLAWEELPSEMVDWAKTEAASAQHEAEQAEAIARLRADRVAEIAASIDSDRSLEVTPGIFLPDEAGFYVLDGQTIVTMEQTQAEARVNRMRAAARIISGMPLISTKHNIEVPGKKAKIRLRSEEPEFYIRTADRREPHLTLVRVETDGDKRRVTVAVTDMVGTVKYEHKEVPFLASEPARGMQRLVMSQKLAPGEYALVETISDGLSMYVWDFGVDPPQQAESNDR